VLNESYGWLSWLDEIDIASNHEENQPKLVASAALCTKEMDRLLAEGMPTDVPIKVGVSEYVLMTMKDAKAKVCDTLARRAKTFAKDVGTARPQRTAATAAPYKKVGITGDRLALLVDHIDYAMYGVGGGKLTTPAQLKRANVIFELLGPDTDGIYILRRYQFRGDALISTSSGDFIRRPPARFYH
jgi:hypothetical protein